MAIVLDAWLPVLNALLEAPKAWRKPAELAATLGRDVEETTDMLCHLDLAGWLVIWEAEDGPAVTLSPLGAERLGARLVEVGHGETPRWARAGDPDPRPIRSRHVCQTSRGAAMDFIHDHAMPPEIAAERGERIESRGRAAQASTTAPAPVRSDEHSRPTVLVGIGMTPWPGPRDATTAPCPACQDRLLSAHMYCLYCDRWGLDVPKNVSMPTNAAPVPPSTTARRDPKPRTISDADRCEADRAMAERLRAKRKAKRQRKRLARLEMQRNPKPSLAGSTPDAAPRQPGFGTNPGPAMDFTRPPRSMATAPCV